MVKNLLLLLTLILCDECLSQTIVRLPSQQHEKMVPIYAYEKAVIQSALEATVTDYGSYRFEYASRVLPRKRLLKELMAGTELNVTPMTSSMQWEKNTLPVYFPIRKGTIGYRLLLVHKDNLPKLEGVQSLDDIKTLSAGQDFAWISGERMQKLGFKIYNNMQGDQMFAMLNHNRFDYFPFGILNAAETAAKLVAKYENIRLEPTKLLLMFNPCYVFVSPKTPELAKRLEAGLWRIFNSGELDSLFIQYHDVAAMRQSIEQRQVLNAIPDSIYQDHPHFKTPSLWFYGWPEFK